MAPLPLHPASLPSVSRHLTQDVEALEGSYQRELAVNRKRSWSSTLNDDDVGGGAEQPSRFGAGYGGDGSQGVYTGPAVKVEEAAMAAWGRALLEGAGQGQGGHGAGEHATGYVAVQGYEGEGYGYAETAPVQSVGHVSYAL